MSAERLAEYVGQHEAHARTIRWALEGAGLARGGVVQMEGVGAEGGGEVVGWLGGEGRGGGKGGGWLV